MEITKIPKAEIVQSARETLSKIRSNQYDVMDNVTYTLGLIIGTALENGYKLEVNFFESGFNDFVELITQRIKAQYCFVVISIPRNPPLFVLNEIRGICDQAIHSITNIDRTLINKPFIKCIAILLTVCKEYGVRYSINENEFFDFIDTIIKRFKDEESVVIVTASDADLLTMVKEKLRLIHKYTYKSIAIVDDTIENDGYILYRVALDKETNKKYDLNLAINILNTNTEKNA